MKNRAKLHPKHRSIEFLEPRNLLAGNVSAGEFTGFLLITGDDSANVITVTQIDATTFKVTGAGTKVNGSNSPQTVTGVTDGIGFQMFGGNDVLTLKNLNTGSLNGTLGNGADVLLVTGCTTQFGNSFDAGEGNNAMTVAGCNFNTQLQPGGLFMAGGGGVDAFVMTNTTVHSGLLVELGNGTNALTMVNVTVTGSSDLPFITTQQDSVSVPDCGAIIFGGSGVDAIVMNNVKIDCVTDIDTEGGVDSVAIVNSRFGTLPATMFSIESVDSTDLSGLCIETGLGNDAVSIVNTTVYGFLQIDTSGQICCPTDQMHDSLTAQEAPSSVKDGIDAVALAKVTVKASAVMQLCPLYAGDDLKEDLSVWSSTLVRDECGALLIYTGNQIDAVSLASVNTDCKACIITTDCGDTSLDGADAVAIANSKFNQNGMVTEWFLATYSYGSTGLEVTTGRGNDVVSIVNVNVNGKTKIETGDGTDAVAVNGLHADEICIRLGGGNHEVLTIINSSAADAIFDGGDGSGDVLIRSHNNFGSQSISGFETVV